MGRVLVNELAARRLEARVEPSRCAAALIVNIFGLPLLIHAKAILTRHASRRKRFHCRRGASSCHLPPACDGRRPVTTHRGGVS